MTGTPEDPDRAAEIGLPAAPADPDAAADPDALAATDVPDVPDESDRALRDLAAIERGPVDPDPAFAERLRDRLTDAVLRPAPPDPEGEPVTTTTGSTTTGTATPPSASASVHAVSPYLAVTDARAALDFYVDVLGATRRGDPIVIPDGRIGHAEIAFGDSVVMLADEAPEIAHTSAASGGAALRVEVADVDVALERARERGATVEQAAADGSHGRRASIRDPYGQRWMLAAARIRTVDDSPVRHGEGGYFTLAVPDEQAATAFYGSVLGWRFTPGTTPRAWAAEGPGLPGAGVWGGQGYAGWKVMYVVDDLDGAVGRVRAAGGRAGDVQSQHYGRTADCVDDQGIEFWLWEA